MIARESRRGLVVARHRRHVTVEGVDGHRVLCQTATRSLQPLIGDEVDWTQAPDGTGLVTRLRARRATLSRIDSRGRRELVVANLTQVLVVVAPVPAAEWLVVDHYLVGAELEGLAAALVVNKVDLKDGMPRHLECYSRAGYVCYQTSASSGYGLDALEDAMRAQRSVFVGQSGVGKSSLLNALLGHAAQDVGALTSKGAQGRHTTSSAVLHRLPNGGELVDAPGVRAYAPYIDAPADLEQGFREFRAELAHCRFDDCRHLAEPDCAVKAAVAAGRICQRRYDSYRRLYALLEELRAKRENRK